MRSVTTESRRRAAKEEKVVMPKPKEWAKGLKEEVSTRKTEAAQRKSTREQAAQKEQEMLIAAFAPIRRYISEARKAGASQLDEPGKDAIDYSYQTSSRWVFFTLDDDIEVTSGFGVRVVPMGWAGEKKPRFETYDWDEEAAQNQFYRKPEPVVHSGARSALKAFTDRLQRHLSYMAAEAPSV
jgi:hypothetical protein